MFREIPKFPSVIRDVSFTVPSDVKASEVSQEIGSFDSNILMSHRLFDFYLLEGRKSFTYTLEFNNSSRTLNDDEVNSEISNLISYLGKKLKAELRK
ncbi:MAG: hypothetical protein N2510_03685 [Ignavibacteria bacterium]|nr:hypothetical protein [Ignavibacteria bacterium]